MVRFERLIVACNRGERVSVARSSADRCAYFLGILEDCEEDSGAGVFVYHVYQHAYSVCYTYLSTR